jgi:hypothetical protein
MRPLPDAHHFALTAKKTADLDFAYAASLETDLSLGCSGINPFLLLVCAQVHPYLQGASVRTHPMPRFHCDIFAFSVSQNAQDGGAMAKNIQGSY